MPRQKATPKTKRVTIPANAIVWVPGEKLPMALQDEVERQVQDFNTLEEEKAGEQLTAFCGPKHWNVSEVLYSVFGYLTGRKTPLILSSNHNAAPIADILMAIVQENKLPACRPDAEWPKLDIPKDIDTITNEGQNKASRSYSPDEVYSIVLPLIQCMDLPSQNRILATLLEEVRDSRTMELNFVSERMESFADRGDRLTESMEQLETILKGKAAIIKPVKFEGTKKVANG
jgi:hypothetical protein